MLKRTLAVAAAASLLTLGVSHVAGAEKAPSADSGAVPSQADARRALMAPAPAPDTVRASYSRLAADGSQQDIAGVTSARAWAHSTAAGACVKYQHPSDLGPGGSCFTTETLAAGNAWFISGSPATGFRLLALVPDGAQTASITLADGTERTVAVVRNTIMLETKVNVRSYTYSVDRAAHTVAASGFAED